MPPRDRLTELFDRLCDLPLELQRIELEGLALGQSEREELERLLAADQSNDDPIRQAVIRGAARMQRPQSVRFGAWRLIRELGAGGMGTVFLAERVEGEFQQQVAVKLLRGFPTNESMRRLRQERQILAGLDHPNIARLLDGGETDDGQPWLAMEYVPGSPLLEYVHRHAPSMRDRLALFDAMLDAIEHAHQHLIIHRDLKPANVLLADGGTVKLLDFGIARLIAVSDHEQRSTSTRIYSHGYASPEQKAGGTITTASDTFSLGVILREMLTGARETGAEYSPLIHPLKLDADMAGIIAKATSLSADDRYSGVSELRNDLDRYRDGRPVRASAMTRRYRLRKFVGRHRLVSIACVVIVTILALFVWRLDRERNRARIAEAIAQEAREDSERDAANARASLAFLTDALSAAGPDAAMNTQVRVRDLLDAAREKLELRSKSDGSFTKPMQRLLGALYSQLGETRIARDLLGGGLEGVAPKNGSEALRLADAYEEYSMVLGALADNTQSLAAARTASQWRERYAPNDELLRMRSLQMLGMVFHRDGKDEEAIKLLRKAYQLGIAKSISDVDSRTESAQLLASLLATRGDCEDALKVADEGLALVASTGPVNPTMHVPLLRARASALNTCGRPADAEAVLRQAISMQESLVADRGSRMMHLTNDLALTLNDLGRYEEAARLLGRSDQFMRETGLGGMDEAVSWANRAGILENAGDYDASLLAIEQAIKLLDEDHVDAENQVRRRIDRSQARTFGLVGRHDEAWKMLSKLRQACERIEGKDSGEYAMLTWQLASLAGRMKDSARGLPLLEESEQLWSALVPETHAVFAHALRFRAGFAVARHAYGEADQALTKAITMFEKGAASPVDLAIARSELAELRALEKRPVEARHLLGMAMPVLRSSVLATEVNRIRGERLAVRLHLRI